MSPSQLTAVKSAYHRYVPKRIRYPIGALRRRADDLGLRLISRRPLPPRHLLESVQMTPRLREYLDVGRRSAAGLKRQLRRLEAESRWPRPDQLYVLDFGCGLGRTLRHFDAERWRLAGCDVDERLISWCRKALDGVEWRVNRFEPPLPFPDGRFDVLWSISVFTHFAESEQHGWAAEMARVLRPGGLALISLMGPHAMGAFPELEQVGREALVQSGYFFQPAGDAFNQRGAFHTQVGVERFFGEYFELESWLEAGLDGFQDLAVLLRK